MKKFLLLCLVICICIPCCFANEKYRNYKPYMGELKNEVLETKSVTNNKITIVRKKLQPVSNVASYAFCYEYIISNNTGVDIVINNVTSQDRITLMGAWGRSQIPQKSDFVPVYGIVKGVKTDVEKNRFTKQLPENETISAGDTMRVLTLAPKSINHVATFNFMVNNKNVSLTVK